MKYLLDTNILVHLLRKHYAVKEKIENVGWKNCCVSEITMIELLYGAEISKRRESNLKEVEQLLQDLEVIPISVCIREFCRQKARLRSLGRMIEDYDLFIGATSIVMGCTLVSENTEHMKLVEGVKLQNWVTR